MYIYIYLRTHSIYSIYIQPDRYIQRTSRLRILMHRSRKHTILSALTWTPSVPLLSRDKIGRYASSPWFIGPFPARRNYGDFRKLWLRFPKRGSINVRFFFFFLSFSLSCLFFSFFSFLCVSFLFTDLFLFVFLFSFLLLIFSSFLLFFSYSSFVH